MKRHILFVDEEHYFLKALKRGFRKFQEQWQISYAESGAEALTILDQNAVDILVTEIRLSGMDGLELLEKVKATYPHVVRIILSGYANQDVILKSAEIAHQFHAKPCDAQELQATIGRALLIYTLLRNDALRKTINQVDSLPSLPTLYTEIMAELRREEPSMAKISETVAKDLGMTAKVLQLVNSSFLGLPTKITTPSKAVSLLGLDMVRAIALTAGAFSKYGNLKIPGFSIDEMWHHGLNCGVIVKLIAQAEKLPRQELETAFMAALLHDIGKILLAIHMPEQFSQALHATNSGQIPFHEAEYSVIGATHAELGAYLLGLWGLPESVVQAVCQHHQLRAEPAGGLTTELIVHVANALEHADAEVLTSEAPLKGIDHAHLSALGYGQRLAHWRQLCATRLDEA